MSDIVLTLGNVAPHQAHNPHRHGAREDLGAVLGAPDPTGLVRLDPLVNHTTTVVVPAGATLARVAADCQLLWQHHSADAPGWLQIASDLSPDEVGDLESTLRVMLGIPRPTGPTALLTNAGVDFIAKQMAGSASATAVAKWIALTANTGDPAAGDTTLTGEITTASGGLVRQEATYAHTAAASTYTLSETFTANANDSLPVTIAKAGNFDAASSGNMPFETLLSATATLTAAGDNIPLTWTITI